MRRNALKALIFEDLKIHSNSKASEIVSRLPDTPLKEIRKVLYKGIKDEEIMPAGKNKIEHILWQIKNKIETK